jgi:hypothetical protein
MPAYHGNEELKMRYISTALEHEEADSYVKGLYWADAQQRGCNIGCWTKAETGKHDALSGEMGVAVELLHLSDGLFEALPDPHYKRWSRLFAGAIPVGADLCGVGGELLEWLMCDGNWGLMALSGDTAKRMLFLEMGGQLRRGWLQGEPAPEALAQDVEEARRSLVAWKRWDEHALRDMRATRASLELWRAHRGDPKSLSRAAWSARAAWGASEAYTLAQAEALMGLLSHAPRLAKASLA